MVNLAASHKFKGDEPEIALMIAAFENDQAAKESKPFAYALGKMFNDLKEYDKAFHYFALAGALYEIDKIGDFEMDDFSNQKRGFTPSLIQKKAKLGHKSAKPIFVVGMPRSGTTLTEQILASHPDICGVGEQLAFKRLNMRLIQLGDGDLGKGLNAATSFHLETLGENYLNTMRAYSTTAKHYADKMPHNFKNVGLINIIFPNAKIVFCNRDAIDNCVSIFTSPLNDGHAYAKDLTTLGKYYRDHISLMGYWKSVSKIPIFDMKYENTVADLEGQARALIKYVGLPWNDACLKFNEAKTQVSTISTWQVRQPIYSTSVKRWKVYEKHLGPLIEALGDLAVID